MNSYKSGVPSAPIRLSKTGGAPGSSMGQQSVTVGPPLPLPRLQIDHSCDDEDDNYLPLDSFRLSLLSKPTNSSSGAASLLVEPPGLPTRRHSSHPALGSDSGLHPVHSRPDHLNHQRHYSVQHQSIHHHLPHQAGGMRGHPPHHLPVPTTMHPEADIHIEQHPSLEGFPPHHVNGYKLLEAHYPPPVNGESHIIRIPKCSPTLGMVIEGGVNTDHPLARIISIQTEGAAFQAGGLKIGQLISYVDGCPLSGMSHEASAHLIADCFAKRDPPYLTLVVTEHRPTPSEMRRSCMLPQ